MLSRAIFSGFVVVPLIVLFASHSSPAADYYVNAAARGSSSSGLDPEKAFGTIQEACDVVAPGDVVHVAPGVYFENVQLKHAGQAGRPITFRAEETKWGSVILTAAREDIRKQSVTWELVDPTLNLYAVPHTEKPSRVLYDGVDLLPYPSLANLKAFRFDNGIPGTLHGFAYEGGKLYVRLHASGKYGAPDPAEHVMAVSPAGSAGDGAAIDVQSPRDSIMRIQTGGPSHIIIDGITFETPGIAAIYAPDGDVVVRNCWFFGCRSAVSGRATSPDTSKNTDRITIENCEYTQHPAFDDMLEVIRLHTNDPWRGDRKAIFQRIFWWQRKGDQKSGGIGYSTTYETGIATNIGNDWVIRRNHIHDVYEALSMWATDHSKNLQVYENRIERVIDNAVECENRSVGLSFHHNEIVDVFEPFSWQPLRATPWPGPNFIYSNLVVTTPPMQGVWKAAGQVPGVWKLGASENNWKRRDITLSPDEPVRAGGEGFLSYNNTVYCPGSVAITRVQDARRTFENFYLFNNVCVLDDLSTIEGYRFPNIVFAANVAAFLSPHSAESAAAFAGKGGVVAEAGKILTDLSDGKYRLAEGSPARGMRRPDSPASAGPDAGAVPYGGSWALAPVGPQPPAPIHTPSH